MTTGSYATPGAPTGRVVANVHAHTQPAHVSADPLVDGTYSEQQILRQAHWGVCVCAGEGPTDCDKQAHASAVAIVASLASSAASCMSQCGAGPVASYHEHTPVCGVDLSHAGRNIHGQNIMLLCMQGHGRLCQDSQRPKRPRLWCHHQLGICCVRVIVCRVCWPNPTQGPAHSRPALAALAAHGEEQHSACTRAPTCSAVAWPPHAMYSCLDHKLPCVGQNSDG